MNQYNSYYLYQQFEKRGSQDWLPCYPNIFSVDGDGTMPLVMKKENDPDCGYTGDTEPIYRWYPLPISTDYICDECPVVQYRWHNMDVSTDYYCDGTTKYYKQIRQYSYDSGTTWYDVTPPEYQQGGVYEQQSTDCGYVPPIEPQYRTTSGTPYCEGVDKYVDVYSQVSYDGGSTWSTTATTPTLVEHNSADCGYIEPQYRTTSGTPYCSGETGYDKYINIYNQVSYDGGITWETTATTTSLIEEQSADCGFVPKLVATYRGGTTYKTACGESTLLTTGDTRPSGYFYTSMTNAVIGECVTGIGNYAFDHCTGLTSVTIPDVVTSIGNDAFYYCRSLTSVTIPDIVTSIGDSAFYGCTGLTSIEIPSGVTSINHYAFGSCTSLANINIPSGVTSIGNFAFDNCTSFTSIDIPGNVTSIGNDAFSNCTGLTSVAIPDSVVRIGDGAFASCRGLTGITVEATTPPTLGSDAFYGTNNCPIYVPCESISRYKSTSSWRYYSDRIRGCTEQYRTTSGTPYCTGADKYIDVYSQVSYDGGSTWSTTATTPTLVEHNSQDCGYMTRTTTGTPYCEEYDKYVDVYSQVSYDSGETWSTTATTPTLVEHNSVECGYSPIPAGTKLYISYGNGDVYTASCDSNTTLGYTDTRPSGYQYELIYHIGIGDCITSIGNNSIYYCTGLTNIVIPDTVTSIGSFSFSACYSLTNINIPSGVTSIGDGAFYYCTGLTGVTVNSVTPPTLTIDEAGAFDNTNDCPIYVPSGSVNTYKSASGWSTYSSRIQAIP